MTPRPLDYLGWLAAAIVVVGFCLPWLKFTPENAPARPQAADLQKFTQDLSRSGIASYLLIASDDAEHARYGIGEGLNGRDLVSIYRDPRYQHEAEELSTSQLLGTQRQSDRIVFTWAAPVFAAFAVMFLFGCRKRWPLLLPWAGCFGFYLLCRFRLNTTYVDRFVTGPYAGLGLWLTLYGLLLLAIILCARIIVPNHPRF